MVNIVATSKGRITIPSAIRRRLSIRSGTRLALEIDEMRLGIILTPITKRYIASQRGRFRGRRLLEALAAANKCET